MKSEPYVYSIDHLERDGRESWEGVRNYQARNFMREMAVGDLAFFYHSSVNPPGIAGVCKVVKEAYADPTQFEESSDYYDPKSKKDAPRWSMVDVEFVEKFAEPVTLEQLKAEPRLKDMRVVQKGRLSVQPAEKSHFQRVLEMAGAKTKA